MNPQIAGTRPESITRRLGFFERPEPAEMIANYLRGYLLFGRNTSRGDWFHWHTLPLRSVITRQWAHLNKNRRRQLRSAGFEFRYDQDLEQIMRLCQQGRDGWLTESVIEVYLSMRKLGLVTSLGAYRDGQLVAGFWGLSVGHVVAMMSMFHLEDNVGSMMVANLVNDVSQGKRWSIIDCSGPGEHWRRYGARTLNQKQFSALVTSQLFAPEDKLDFAEWTTYDSACSPKEVADGEEPPMVSSHSPRSLSESHA